MDIKIERTITPCSKDIDFLTQKINEETPDFGEAHPFAFFIRDDHNSIIAGCNGSVFFGTIYVDQLWVHPDYRGKGYGRKLMEATHKYGREIGCKLATVCTMSFQGAKAFYEHIGYECDFERSGYIHGEKCLFLRKIL